MDSKKAKDEEEYKEFLEKSKKCNFQQSLEWAEVKKDWRKEIILIKDEEENPVMGIMLLIRHVKFFGTIIYVSRGPIYDKLEEKYFEELTKKIKEVAKREKAIAVLLEPDVTSDDNEFKEMAIKLGYKIKDNIKRFSEQINPRYVFRLNLQGKEIEDLKKEFHSKTRYNIGYAEKKGVEVIEGKREDLKRFQEIMEETGKRDRIWNKTIIIF